MFPNNKEYFFKQIWFQKYGFQQNTVIRKYLFRYNAFSDKIRFWIRSLRRNTVPEIRSPSNYGSADYFSAHIRFQKYIIQQSTVPKNTFSENIRLPTLHYRRFPKNTVLNQMFPNKYRIFFCPNTVPEISFTKIFHFSENWVIP